MNRRALMMATFLAFNPLVWGAENGKAKESYVKKIDQEIQGWNVKVDHLEKRAERAGAKTRVEFDAHVQRVREKLDIARQKLSEMEGSSESGWRGFRRGADEALQDVKHAYQNATSFLKKNKNKEEK